MREASEGDAVSEFRIELDWAADANVVVEQWENGDVVEYTKTGEGDEQ